MPRVLLNNRQTEARKVSDWVRWNLRDSKHNQSELGEYLGLSQQAVSNRLRGHSPWTVPEIAECCEFFGTSYTVGQRFSK